MLGSILSGAGAIAGLVGGGKNKGQTQEQIQGFQSFPKEVQNELLKNIFPRIQDFGQTPFATVPYRRAGEAEFDPIFGSRALQDLQRMNDDRARKPMQDGAAYLAANQDVAAAGYTPENALQHYENYGRKEGRSLGAPSSIFSPSASSFNGMGFPSPLNRPAQQAPQNNIGNDTAAALEFLSRARSQHLPGTRMAQQYDKIQGAEDISSLAKLLEFYKQQTGEAAGSLDSISKYSERNPEMSNLFYNMASR